MNIRDSISNALTSMLDNFYIREIRKDPEILFSIANPSEKVIIALAEIELGLIPHIEDNYPDKLTNEVKKAMLQKNPDALVWFYHVDDELISDTLKNHGDRLSEETKLSIVNKKPTFIGDIKNPSEEVQKLAVKKNPGVITLIDKPCEFVQYMAVKNDPVVLSLIDTTEDVRMEAIEKDPHNIKYIDSPSDELKAKLVELDPCNILLVPEPSAAICATALKEQFVGLNDIPESNDIIEPTLQLFESVDIAKDADNNIHMENTEHITKALNAFMEKMSDIQYFNNHLSLMCENGHILTDEMANDKYKQLINDHFSREYSELYSLHEKTDADRISILEGKIRLKAGELLEDKGVLPFGFTEIKLTKEGYYISELREINEGYLSNPDNKLEKEFLSAVDKRDFEGIAFLCQQGYHPSQELMQSLSDNISQTTLVTIQKVLGMETVPLECVQLTRSESPVNGVDHRLSNPVEQSI